MRPIQPTKIGSTPQGLLRQAQSVYKTLAGNVQEVQPTGQNAAGIYNQFEQDNGSGVAFRIGAVGGTETYNWTGNNVALVINHGLQRQPIGFRLWDKSASTDVYQIGTPTTNNISLATTNDAADVTVYIF